MYLNKKKTICDAMEKLHIRLENEQLRPQLDWIIDRASENNFDYPAVINFNFICYGVSKSIIVLNNFNLDALENIFSYILIDSWMFTLLFKWTTYHVNQLFKHIKEFWTYTEMLWKDKGIQQCFERSNEYQLIDCAK